jgi:O-antigen/teichoic acid export membrane protein
MPGPPSPESAGLTPARPSEGADIPLGDVPTPLDAGILPDEDPAASAPGFRRLTRDSLVYGVGTFSGKAIGLLLFPILARVLSRADYGLLDVLWSLGTGFAGVLLFGLDAAAVRLYFDETVRDRADLLATWRAILAATALMSAVALIVAAPWVAEWASGTGSDRAAALALGLIVPATLFNYYVVTVLRTTGRPIAYAVLTTATFVVYGAAIVASAIGGWATVGSTMAAWGLSLTVTSVLGFWALRSTAIGRVRGTAAGRLLRYGLPLAPVLAVTLASDFIQRAVLLTTNGAVEVAQLTVALRFASILALVVAAFQLAWQPRVFAMGSSALALRRMATDARRFLALAAVVAMSLGIVAPTLLPIIAGEQYRTAVPTVGWCLAAALLGGVYAMAITASTIRKRPAHITRSTVAGIGLAVALNVVLAPRYGSVGTGASLVAGQVVAVLVAMVEGRRILILPGPWRSTGLVVVSVSASLVAWTADLPPGLGIASIVIATVALVADPTVRDIVALAWDRWRRPMASGGGRP